MLRRQFFPAAGLSLGSAALLTIPPAIPKGHPLPMVATADFTFAEAEACGLLWYSHLKAGHIWMGRSPLLIGFTNRGHVAGYAPGEVAIGSYACVTEGSFVFDGEHFRDTCADGSRLHAMITFRRPFPRASEHSGNRAVDAILARARPITPESAWRDFNHMFIPKSED